MPNGVLAHSAELGALEPNKTYIVNNLKADCAQ